MSRERLIRLLSDTIHILFCNFYLFLASSFWALSSLKSSLFPCHVPSLLLHLIHVFSLSFSLSLSYFFSVLQVLTVFAVPFLQKLFDPTQVMSSSSSSSSERRRKTYSSRETHFSWMKFLDFCKLLLCILGKAFCILLLLVLEFLWTPLESFWCHWSKTYVSLSLSVSFSCFCQGSRFLLVWPLREMMWYLCDAFLHHLCFACRRRVKEGKSKKMLLGNHKHHREREREKLSSHLILVLILFHSLMEFMAIFLFLERSFTHLSWCFDYTDCFFPLLFLLFPSCIIFILPFLAPSLLSSTSLLVLPSSSSYFASDCFLLLLTASEWVSRCTTFSTSSLIFVIISRRRILT